MKFTLPPDTPKGQKDAITANDSTITVEAGAGTGKTWVLSERYLRLLLENDELLPSDILTLTYTDAAAGEMKARIEARIQEAMKDFPNNERRQAILDGLSDTWISTIHAFAGRLIRESGLSLDIDPRASVITAHQEQAFWEDIRNAAEFAGMGRLARNYAGGELLSCAKSLDNDAYMSAAVSKWNAGTLSTFARKTAELHASSGHSWQDMLKWSGNDVELLTKSAAIVRDILRSVWLNLWKDWQNVRLQNVKADDVAGNAMNNFLDTMRADPPADYDGLKNFYDRLVTDEGIAGRTRVFSQLKGVLGGETFGAWRKKQKAGIIYNIMQSFYAPITPQEAQMRRTLLKFCAVCWGMWDMMKAKRGLLSFSDMILHAGRTIQQKGIRRTFRHILVDEFQDTDPLQFAMIEALKDYGEDTGLFAVGDPKQSIYKFRYADPALFAEVISREGTKKVNLDTSFRTRASLLTRINSIFSSLWPNGISRQKLMKGVKYNPLDPANPDIERESGTMPDFRIFLARNDGGVEASKRLLAEHLAAKISSWVEGGLTVWDKKEKIIRAVKFSDFAILSRRRACFPILEEVLEKYGIPSVQDRSNDYFNRGEIGDVVCILRAAADMNDDFAVTGWLMSPFSGVDEHNAITKCLMLADETHRPADLIRDNLPDAYSRLQYLSVVGENEGASGILELYDRNRQWLSCYRTADRLRVLRNIRLALRIAREFQASGTAGLSACAEYMTRSVRDRSGYEEPSWHDEGENAVRLGAVHSAKGLEYPVTVIFEDRISKRGDNHSLSSSRELGVIVKSLPDEMSPSADFRSKLTGWHKLLSEQGDIEEEERLFYVACTRAQDSLIFCGLVTPKDGSGYANTWTKFMLDNVIFIPEYANTDSTNNTVIAGHDEQEKELKPVNIVNVTRSLRQFSATSFALYEWCPYAWRRSYRQGLTLLWELPDRDRDAEDEEAHGGAELGSLAHWILSRWPKGEDYANELDYLLDDSEVLRKIPGYLRNVWKRGDKVSLRRWLMNFVDSDWGVKLRNNPDVVREYTFRIALTGGPALSGSIDVVYGNNVLDYKITAINDVPPGLYEAQLDFYAYVIHEQTGFESVNTCIAFLKENKVAERVIYDFAPIRERILKAAEICASGPYEPKHNHCGQCPFKKGCVKYAG